MSHWLRKASAGVSGAEVHSPPMSRSWPPGESTRWRAVASSTRSWHLVGRMSSTTHHRCVSLKCPGRLRLDTTGWPSAGRPRRQSWLPSLPPAPHCGACRWPRLWWNALATHQHSVASGPAQPPCLGEPVEAKCAFPFYWRDEEHACDHIDACP
jgi:hypothetical protein